MVGRIVRRTLDNFTEDKLFSFVESKVDNDLQHIRINGALFGTFLGTFFYGVLTYGLLLKRLITKIIDRCLSD